jgi:predicted acetyltransferase
MRWLRTVAAGQHRRVHLVVPTAAHLPSFVDALRRGWSPSTEHDVSAEVLAEIDADPADFLAGADDPDPQGRTVTLPDGSVVPRLPSFARWMWDGEFAGSINVRWQPGTTALPPHCLGHIGYSVVPWKRRRGYATEALRLVLIEARTTGLPYVEITTDPDNVASQRVIEANGGVLVERFDKGAAYGHGEALRYTIALG